MTVITTDPDEIRRRLKTFTRGKISATTATVPVAQHPYYPNPRNHNYMRQGIHERINMRAYMWPVKSSGITNFLVPEYTFQYDDQ